VVRAGGAAGEDDEAVACGEEAAFEDGADVASPAGNDDLHEGSSFAAKPTRVLEHVQIL
jgi:hypothetical protein